MSQIETETEERQRLLSPRAEPEYGSVVVDSPSTRWRTTFIEPVLFFILMSLTLSDMVITNLLEYRICRVLLKLPEVNCTEPLSPAVEDLVQPTTAQIIMIRSVLHSFIPSFLFVLIGPWSDTNGRKPFLVISLAGITVTYFCWGCLTLLPNLNPYVFLVASLPLSGTGGIGAVFLLVICYLSDVTDERTRPSRMSLMTLVVYTSGIFGTVFAPILLTAQHSLNPYPAIFFLSASLLLLSTLITHWFIKESVDLQLENKSKFFTCRHVKDMLLICFQRRSGHARPMILLIITAFCLNDFIGEGESAVFYLTVRKMFSWQLSDYSIYHCFSSIILGVGALGGVWVFSTLLGLPNMFLTAILYTTRSARSVMMAVARSSYQFYIATAVGTFVAGHSALCRTELSRMVTKQDLGKIFALISFLQCVIPLTAVPLYTFIYQLTFLDFAGAIFFFSAIVAAISVLLALVVFIMQRLVRGECYNYEQLREDNTETAD